MSDHSFTVLHVDLESGQGTRLAFGDNREVLGGSGLAAALFEAYGNISAPWHDPRQPLVFAIGPLTGYFPLMSKTVCGFKSPYTGQFAESHAGGRLALALRFAKLDALMITGCSKFLAHLVVGSRNLEFRDVHYLRGQDVFSTGKLLRRVGKGSSAGHRSILRIGMAGELGQAMACVNVDTYRHFGRLGAGAVMGCKNLKAITVLGDSDIHLPEGKEYPNLYKEIFQQLTTTDMMHKYHDLGTPENLVPLNELKALPWRNLQATSDPGVTGISGETFAEQLLLRQAACSGCPVGCIHIGLLRQQFAKDHEFLYRQVSYDYEPIFAQGSMLGLTVASEVLALLDECEKQGLDVVSAGVALAWATEAMEKGFISTGETLVELKFGEVAGFLKAVRHLGGRENEFYALLGRGALTAAKHYGGEDFACVLGQEMAGYATGEVYFVSQALGFRHSHLDSGGYSYDQKAKDKDAAKAADFMVEDERKRLGLTSMVSCLFARGVYSEERLQQALSAIGKADLAEALPEACGKVQRLRWKLKFDTGYRPEDVPIPKRYLQVTTWKGPIDPDYLKELRKEYGQRITRLAE